jgi:DNA-binding transcriptional LysR family regulator
MVEHRPKLHQIDAFRAVMGLRSVTEAARLLRVSQPAVSKSLRQLEDVLGFALFERVGGRLLPTAEAEAVAPALDSVATSLAAAVAAGRAVREGASGLVTIATVSSLSLVILPEAIEAATRRLPGLRVATQVLLARSALEAVVRGRADIGLVHDLVEDPLVAVEDLGRAAMACALPKGHPLAARRRLRPRDLRGLAYASYAPESPIGQRLQGAFEADGEAFSPAFELAASPVVCQVALKAGVVAVVENYVPSMGWWPALKVVPLVPEVPIALRLLTTLQRPVPRSARILGEEFRRAVARILPRPSAPRQRPSSGPA